MDIGSYTCVVSHSSQSQEQGRQVACGSVPSLGTGLSCWSLAAERSGRPRVSRDFTHLVLSIRKTLLDCDTELKVRISFLLLLQLLHFNGFFCTFLLKKYNECLNFYRLVC